MRPIHALILATSTIALACGEKDDGGGSSTAGAGGTDDGSDTTGDDGDGDTTDDSGDGGETTETSSTGDGGTGTTGGTTGGLGPFELTSTAFEMDGVIPDAHTCHGVNDSPALDWTPGPAGTMSYAMVLNDDSISYLHSAIWNIPASVTELPAAIEKAYMPSNVPGATQCDSWDGMMGYSGPCPGSQHTYEFIVYAVNVDTLPGVDSSSSVAEVVAALDANNVGTATLSGTFTPP